MAKARLYFDGDNTYIEKQARIYKMVDEIGDKIDNIPGVINDLSSTSETDALSAAMGKELQDQINAMSGNFHFLSSWDCTTGLPGSDPAVDPYTYQSGDYYIVSNTGSTNYKPHGSSYTHGVASTAVETQPVQMNDWYVYDGSTWILQPSGGAQIVIDTALSTTSTNPVENRVITQALNNKQDTIANLSAIESGAAAGATALQPGDNITQLTNNAGYQTAGDVAAAIVGKQDVLTAGEGIAINNNIITNTGITCLTGGDDIQVIQGGNTHDLPAAYTELEYIYTSGGSNSGGYIDTGFTIGGSSIYSNTDIALEYIAQLENTGSYNVSGTAFASGIGVGVRSNLNVSYGVGGLVDNGTTMPAAKLKYYINGATGDVKITNDTGIDLFTATATTSTKTGGVNIMIYTYPSSGTTPSSTRGKGFMYEFKILDGRTNEILWHGIPAMRNSDDVVGMYDIIGEQFFTSSGNAFVAGPETVDCTTVNFTNASGYVTINDVNVKVFNLSSTSDLTTAQAAYNFGASGGVPIIRFSGETFIPHTATFTGGNAPFWAPTTFSNNNSYTVIDAKQLYLYASSGTVTQVNRYGYTSNTLSAGKNYTTPYTPQYDGSPATKKYVDSKLYVGTTAPSSPTAGQLWYDTTNSKLKVYNGSAWEEVGSGGGGGSTTWGNIGGILSNQTDLQDALDDKLEATDLVAGDGINIQAVGSELPSGYTQLAYIQLNGTQALDTGITGVGKSIEVDTLCTNTSASGWQIISSYGEDYLGMFFGVAGGYFAIQNNSSGKITTVDISGRNTVTGRFSLSNNLNKVDIVAGGTTLTYTRTGTRPDGNIHLGGAISTTNTLLYPYSGYIFGARIYNTTTNVEEAHYIPCLSPINVAGFYDTVSDTFLPATKGTFAAGPAVPVEGIEISVDDTVWTNDNVEAGAGIAIDTGTSARLPSGYTEVEYIQSDGNCYVDTLVVSEGTDTTETKFQVLGVPSSSGAVRPFFGSMEGTNLTRFSAGTYRPEGSGSTSSFFFGGWNNTTKLNTADTNVHILQMVSGSSVILDGVNTAYSHTLNNNHPTITSYLFARHGDGNNTQTTYDGNGTKIYYHKQYRGVVQILELIPCTRDSDDEPGFYDLVNERFLANSGSGTLTAGPVVTFDPTNVISSTVLGFNNLTYDSMTMGTWSSSILSNLTFPSTAKMAFLNWRARDNTNTDLVYACGQVLIIRGLTLVSSFVGGGDGTNYIYGGVGLDSTNSYINYTQGGRTSNAVMDYTIYFYK